MTGIWPFMQMRLIGWNCRMLPVWHFMQMAVSWPLNPMRRAGPISTECLIIAAAVPIIRLRNYLKNACPFNYLYWDFISRHEDKWQSNARMGMMVRSWHKMDPDIQQALRGKAADFLADLR